jgi:anti-anti-sigma regulatory factor
MMKIQVNEEGEQVILQIEGRLAGPFVAALEDCWRSTRASTADRRICVDLKNVTCIDRAARKLLQAMHGSGVQFLRAGMAIQDIVEEIREASECKQ